tara:strand:- start:131 stop:286 length:156 start_codon:yes stop_codon:yes gene_type:complete
MKINAERGQTLVHPHSLELSEWEHAVEYALEMARVAHPDAHIEFEYIKEYG